MVVGLNLGSEAALFSTAQHCANFFIQIDGFYAKETKQGPTTIHFKDCGALNACSGFRLCLTSNLLDFNVKPNEWYISSWPCALETCRNWILSRTGEEVHSCTRSLMDLISRHNRGQIYAGDTELFLLWSHFLPISTIKRQIHYVKMYRYHVCLIMN